MPFFREKSDRIGTRAIVQAVQFTGNFDEIEAFVGGDAEFRDGKLVVATRKGPLRASPRDWIVRGNGGAFFALPPHLFADAYEAVPSDPQGGRNG